MSLHRQPDEEDGPGRWPLFLFIASVGFHIAIFYTLHEMEVPEPEHKLRVYEVAMAPPPPPPPEEPEIEEPEPEPEVVPEELPPPPEEPPEIEPPPPPKQKKPPLKQPPAKPQPPASDDLPPPPPIRLPESMTVPSNSGSPVSVNTGPGPASTKGSIGGKPEGKPGGKPGGKGQGTGGTGTAPTGPTWSPKSDAFIRKMPLPKKRPPKIQCPASRDQGVFGTVVLSVDVRKDGTVRKVKVIRGIGSGCDEIAKKAIKKMTLSPAVDTTGRPSDYAGLRYEYVFEPAT